MHGAPGTRERKEIRRRQSNRESEFLQQLLDADVLRRRRRQGIDNSLLPPERERDVADGVGGELWAVHGGGFYHVQKYRVAPQQLPALHPPGQGWAGVALPQVSL